MQKLYLPHVILPSEYLTLLKSKPAVTSSASQVIDLIRPHQSIYLCLEKAFAEFDDGRGLEKIILALGWPNFRERMASVYVYKAIHGHYPSSTSMDLLDDIRALENDFQTYCIHGHSRIFLLGFYLRLANIKIQARENNQFLEIKVPHEIKNLMGLTQGRSERIDWLILILMHLLDGLGEKTLSNFLLSGKKLNEVYDLLSPELRKTMMENLLSYSLSIEEPDFFLFEKV